MKKQPHQLSLLMSKFLYAYKLWINGNLADSCGIVAANKQNHVSEYLWKIVLLPEDTNKYELVLQISDIKLNVGDVATPIYLGYHDKLIKDQNLNIALEFFFLDAY